MNLLTLPNEILLIILKKLDNMDVIYSLLGNRIERLELLAQDEIFTNTLNFVSTNDSIIDRFSMSILPRIQSNIKYLIVDGMTMSHVLFATDYPNLTKLKIFKFNQDIVSRYFTGK
jgi:hypothetical protein